MHEKLTWYKQSAYKWKGDGITLYIDPWGLRKGQEDPADVIFITHAHSDHFEPEDIEKIRKSSTQFVAPLDVAEKLKGNVKAIRPGDAFEVAGIKVEAVRAYNTEPQATAIPIPTSSRSRRTLPWCASVATPTS
jgi:L-ascorbate metabolism protein UlaG (beta-lactamase superfamily)